MLAYLVQLILIVLLFSLLKGKGVVIRSSKKYEYGEQGINTAVVVAFFIIIFMQAFRAPTVGTDVSGYLDFFHRVQNVSNVANLGYNRYGFGFAWVTKIISLITTSDRGYLIITSLIIQIPIAIIIKKYSKNQLMSICLYICLGFYMATFCTLRQSMAYSLCFLSYYGIRERKLLAFALPVICASMLHISAVVFIPAYWIYGIKSKRATLILYLITLMIAFANRVNLVSAFLNRFNDYFSYYSIKETGSYTWMLFCIAIFIFASILQRRPSDKDSFNIDSFSVIDGGLLSIFGIGTILSVCATVAANARRITDYYILFMVLLIPEMYESIQGEGNKRIFRWGIILLCIVFYVVTLAGNSGYGIVPYAFGG